MVLQLAAGLLGCVVLASAGDIQGVIAIERKLTRRNVTASAGLYQRGPAVPLAADAVEDPLAFERSHVAIYVEGSPVRPATQPTLIMEQRDRRFVPDLLVVPAGGTVSFPNFDPIFHNVFSLSKAKSFDLGNYPKGDTRTVTFRTPGAVAVYCHLHPNMAASIVVTPNSFATRAAADGSFALEDVPPGTYTVVAWHKSAGTFRKTIHVTESGGEVNFVLPYVESHEQRVHR